MLLAAASILSPPLALLRTAAPMLMKSTDASSNVVKFPSVDTLPEEVVSAQLQALSDSKLVRVYELFSRARRAILSETGRAQGGCGQLEPSALEIQRRVRRLLDESCPGLIGHGSHEVISGLTLNDGGGRLLPRWRCRVKVDIFYADRYDECDGGFLRAAAAAQPASYYIFTLTRQSVESEPATSEPRRDASDGYAGCWFVWSIEPERRGGGGDDDDDDPQTDGDPLPGLELALPVVC